MSAQVELTNRLVTGYCGNLCCTVGELITANSEAFDKAEICALLGDLARQGWTDVAVQAGLTITLYLLPVDVPDFEDAIDLTSWLADRVDVVLRLPRDRALAEYHELAIKAALLRARENAATAEDAEAS